MVQRVDGASVVVAGETVGEIVGEGLCVLVGVTHEDTPEKAAQLARKLWSLRILEAEKSCSDTGAPLLVISQFTLYGDVRRGRRPSFDGAMPPEDAERAYEAFVREARAAGVTVETGRFRASMKVSSVNDGPVTIWIDSVKSA